MKMKLLHKNTFDRGLRIYHMLRSIEDWHGILLRIEDPANKDFIKSGLDKILEEHEQAISHTKGRYVYCKGVYSPDVLNKLREYVFNVEGVLTSIIVKGKYEDFVSSVWVEELKEKYNLK